MRIKFEASDAAGKVNKRSSMNHIYSHCVVIHFAARTRRRGGQGHAEEHGKK
jgi:hypothetical protein